MASATFTIGNASTACGLPSYVLIEACRAGKLAYVYSGRIAIPDRGDGLSSTADGLAAWLATRTRDEGVL